MGRIFRLSFCIALMVCSATNAQRPEKYFVLGLDSFYQADYDGVVAHMNSAESLGITDARLFLYRGIAKIRSGQNDGGRADLQSAAQKEAQFGARYVGRLMQQLDGTERVALREYREKARMILAKRSGDLAESDSTSFEPSRANVTMATAVEFSDDNTDPFLDESLGRGEIVEVTIPATGNELNSEEGELEIDAEPFADGDSGFDSSFDEGAEFDAGDFEARHPQSSDKKKKGIFGSVIGAIGKAAVPTKAIETVANQLPKSLPGGPRPGVGPSPELDGGAADEMSFDDNNADDAGFEDFGDEMSEDDDNPFANDDF